MGRDRTPPDGGAAFKAKPAPKWDKSGVPASQEEPGDITAITPALVKEQQEAAAWGQTPRHWAELGPQTQAWHQWGTLQDPPESHCL